MSPNSNPLKLGGTGWISDRRSPQITAGTATQTPAQGPAAPTSNRTRRFRGSDFMRMNAPKVPVKKGGPGKKNGNVTGTPWNRASK